MSVVSGKNYMLEFQSEELTFQKKKKRRLTGFKMVSDQMLKNFRGFTNPGGLFSQKINAKKSESSKDEMARHLNRPDFSV